MNNNFDVFLAHNHRDKAQVEQISELLKKRGIVPWLDKEQIPPGRWFQDVIQDTIPNVKSALIFIGSYGLGNWQALELRAFISQCVSSSIPVIPVLLPEVDEIPSSLIFLKELSWVQFGSNLDDEVAIDKLVWGITGIKPSK